MDYLHIEVQTISIDRALEPLLHQVSILTSQYKKKGGRSKRVIGLAKYINATCLEFVRLACEVAKDHPTIENEMMLACTQAQEVSEQMKGTLEHGESEKRQSDSASNTSEKRQSVVSIGRQLVNGVAKILVTADSADIITLNRALEQVENRLKQLIRIEDLKQLEVFMKSLSQEMEHLMIFVKNRQMDLKDTRMKDELGAARATWARTNVMIKTTSKVCIRHPHLESATSNRQLVVEQMRKALNIIRTIINSKARPNTDRYERAGTLASNFEDFDYQIAVEWSNSTNIEQTKVLLEDLFNYISKDSMTIATSSSTRPHRCENIKRLCQECIDSLKILFAGDISIVEQDKLIEKMCKTTQELRYYLTLAMLDHTGDYYYLPTIPLEVVLQKSNAGNKKESEESCREMAVHAQKMEGVAHMACTLSLDAFSVKLVKRAIANIHTLCPQVLNATRSLTNQPKNAYIKENMEVYIRAWQKHMHLLIAAVDEIAPVEEFLLVSESHCLEEVETIREALLYTDWPLLDQAVDALCNRVFRVMSVVREKVKEQPIPQQEEFFTKLEHIHKKALNPLTKCVQAVLADPLKSKSAELSYKVQEVVNLLKEIKTDFSKLNNSNRNVVSLNAFRAELQTTQHEIAKCATDNPNIINHARDIVSLLITITENMITTQSSWNDSISSLKTLSVTVQSLNNYTRELVDNYHNPALKHDILTYLSKMMDHTQKILSVGESDTSDMLERLGLIISSCKTIVGLLAMVIKAAHVVHAKRQTSRVTSSSGLARARNEKRRNIQRR